MSSVTIVTLREGEETAILKRILELNDRGFAPTIAIVKDIANKLLSLRIKKRVGDR